MDDIESPPTVCPTIATLAVPVEDMLLLEEPKDAVEVPPWSIVAMIPKSELWLITCEFLDWEPESHTSLSSLVHLPLRG